MFLQFIRQSVGELDQNPLLKGTPSLSKSPLHLAWRVEKQLSTHSQGEVSGNNIALVIKGNSLHSRTLSFEPFLPRNGTFPAISVDKRCHSHQQLQPPHKVSWWVLKELRKERMPASNSHQTTVNPEGGSECEKHRKRVLDNLGAYQGNDFSEPRLLHLLIHRKVLNSLTWDVWLSLIYKQTFDVWTICPLMQKLFCNLSPTPTPLSRSPCLFWAVLSGLLEICILGLSSKNFCE